MYSTFMPIFLRICLNAGTFSFGTHLIAYLLPLGVKPLIMCAMCLYATSGRKLPFIKDKLPDFLTRKCVSSPAHASRIFASVARTSYVEATLPVPFIVALPVEAGFLPTSDVRVDFLVWICFKLMATCRFLSFINLSVEA